MNLRSLSRAVLALSGALLFATASFGSNIPPPPPAVSQITQTIDNSKRVTLVGNTPAYVTSGTDEGALAGDTQLDGMWLLLKRSPDREQALQQAIQVLHDPNSANFHQWLTAAQLGQSYGPDTADIATIKTWLQSNGFSVGNVTESGLIIEFSGTASQVDAAFQTSMHNFAVDGQTYFSNASDPSIPAALSPVVVGVVSLNNHFPHSLTTKHSPKQNTVQPQPRASSASLAKVAPWQPTFTFIDANGPEFAIAPGDFNTIYNVGPVWASGFHGAGQTVVVVEDSTIKNASDVQTFRTAFGLSGFAGTFTQTAPTGALTCTAATVNADEFEAALDAEWAGATAPDAAVVLAACRSTATTFGGLTAAVNLLNSATPPSIISVSYGECEAGGGATLNAMFNSGWQQAAAEGASVFVSSGDESAASCDANRAEATHGIGVSGWASTPYNVAVGGTDFRDLYDQIGPLPPAGIATGIPQTAYWGSSNASDGGSALSYVPEMPWNDSCASFFLFNFEGFADGGSFCNATGVSTSNFINVVSGSGGPSGCATGAASTSGVVSGTCAGYAKPSWQSNVVGIVNDGVRDLPDVSLFASNGFWSHFYWLCMTDAAQGGGSCDYTNPATAENFNAAGGTSFSAPALAGIQALINQASGQKWGNMNTRYYALAAVQYGSQTSPNTANLTACNSNNGANVDGTCIFRDVTSGDFDVPCRKGTPNCFTAATATGTHCGGGQPCGILSTSTSVSQPAYQSAPGWDFTTGLGTLNVANLVNAMMPSSVTHLVFTVEPNASYTAGATITVKVSLLSAANTVVSTSVAPVTLTLSGGTAGATLIGTTTQNAVNGVATFNVAVDVAGTAYLLHASSGTFTPATSTPFDITAGPAADLTFTTQPATGANEVPNQAFPMVVQVTDAFNNAVSGDGVTLALGNNPTGATLTGGGTVATDASGNASFNVSLDLPGTGYTLVAGDATPLTATSNAFNVAKIDQTITFTSTAPSSAVIGDTYTPTATASSGLTVTISIDPSSASVCSISGGVVTFNAAGACVIDADQAGDDVYNAAPQAQQTVTVSKIPQTITFTSTPPANATVGESYTPTATASSGLTVTLTIDASSAAVCSIDVSDLVTFNGAGTCTIDANQAGDDTYAAAPQVQQSISVAAPTFVFTTEPPADVTQGTALGTVVVTEEDAIGNVISDNSTVVDFTIAACAGTVDLGSVTMVNGVATLNSAQLFYTVATGLQIQATAGAQTVSSTSFDVITNDDIVFADGFESCRL